MTTATLHHHKTTSRSLPSNPANSDPASDGDLLDFEPSADRRVKKHAIKDKIIYVNGMNTTAKGHRFAAETIANAIGSTVEGVYNERGVSEIQLRENMMLRLLMMGELKPGSSLISRQVATADWKSFVADIMQCADDYGLVDPIGAGEIGAVGGAVMGTINPWGSALGGAAFGGIKAAAGAIDRITKVKSGRTPQQRYQRARDILRNNNLATLTLFDHLYKNFRSSQFFRIICHSQGNLITRNALTFLYLVTRRSLDHIYVYGLASPAREWPVKSQMHLRLYTIREDPVVYLSEGESFNKDVAEVADVKVEGNNYIEAHVIKKYFTAIFGQKGDTHRFFDELRSDLRIT